MALRILAQNARKECAFRGVVCKDGEEDDLVSHQLTCTAHLSIHGAIEASYVFRLRPNNATMAAS
jgi:hypothetical protein